MEPLSSDDESAEESPRPVLARQPSVYLPGPPPAHPDNNNFPSLPIVMQSATPLLPVGMRGQLHSSIGDLMQKVAANNARRDEVPHPFNFDAVRQMTGGDAIYARALYPNPKEDEPSDPLVLDMETARGLLLRNDICRKWRHFPLVIPATWKSFLGSTKRLRELQFIPPSDSTTRPLGMGDFYPVSRRFKYESTADSVNAGDDWEKVEALAIQTINDKFPLARYVLAAGLGSIIAAGGAITKALCAGSNGYNPPDIDFFFIDPDVERDDIPDAEKVIKYNKLLAAAVTCLSNLHLNDPDLDNPRIYVFRNDHVTTVYASSNDEPDAKYQFIHRVYPNIGLVLGGFDIGAAAVAWTGMNIVATEMGAWSALAKTVIIDISRRSTSYENRLRKYNYHYHLIFPGLAYRYSIPRLAKYKLEVITELLLICQERGILIDPTNFKDVVQDTSSKYHELLSRAKQNKKAALEAIRTYAYDYGYEFNEDENTLSEMLVPSSDGRILTLATKEKLAEELKARAGASGYNLDAEKFINEVQYPDDHECGEYSMAAYPLRFKMPRLVIDQEKGGGVSPARNPSLQYEFSDYRDGYSQILQVTHAGNRCSDYNDSPAWPHLISTINLAYLLANKPENVVSVLVLKTSKSSPVDGSEPEEDLMNSSLEACAVDIDTYRSPYAKTFSEKIMEVVQASLFQFRPGDVQLLLETGITHSPQGPYQLIRRALSRKTTEIVADRYSYRNRSDGDLGKLAKELLKEDLDMRMASRLSTLGNGPAWILRNPGTQWTSSINPIVENARDWYGKYYYQFLTSNGEVETCLRLLRLRNTPFAPSVMARDIFRRIVAEVVWLNSLPATWPVLDFPQ